MAAIRINIPGQPIRLVDIGPSYGRVFGTNYGGSIVVASALLEVTPTTPPPVPTGRFCERRMQTGDSCARSGDHGGQCRSRAFLDRMALSRRKSL